MSNPNPTIKDIFTFDPSYTYHIKLVTGDVLTGAIVEAYDNGIVLNSMRHIPTDKIAFFYPIQRIQENETDENFVV